MEARELGRFGEERAARYLRLHGYRIVETNYSCRLGEIDLIARKGRYLVFVEVKLRKSGDLPPRANLSPAASSSASSRPRPSISHSMRRSCSRALT